MRGRREEGRQITGKQALAGFESQSTVTVVSNSSLSLSLIMSAISVVCVISLHPLCSRCLGVGACVGCCCCLPHVLSERSCDVPVCLLKKSTSSTWLPTLAVVSQTKLFPFTRPFDLISCSAPAAASAWPPLLCWRASLVSSPSLLLPPFDSLSPSALLTA